MFVVYTFFLVKFSKQEYSLIRCAYLFLTTVEVVCGCLLIFHASKGRKAHPHECPYSYTTLKVFPVSINLKLP